MPLFMDLHKAEDYDVMPTVEDIKKNHIADLAVQEKYGVKFFQYWINEAAGLVFCLMEAPDKESCAAVHREAHGAMPCNIIELQGGDYTQYMGDENIKNEFDIVEQPNGAFDAGYRFIMTIDNLSAIPNEEAVNNIYTIAGKSGGRTVNNISGREMIAFTNSLPAMQCAIDILQNTKDEIRIGISAGEPVTHENEFFGKGIRSSGWLCDIALPRQIIIGSLVKQLTGDHAFSNFKKNKSLKALSPDDEQFMVQLMTQLDELAYQPSFSLDELCTKLGLSRSGLYRKMTALTGVSANNFIQELRLQKALKLFRTKQGNVTQVAYESGFSSTSYFTRSFQKRFGANPLQLLKSPH
jgi:AraC-like DNA-binding protein